MQPYRVLIFVDCSSGGLNGCKSFCDFFKRFILSHGNIHCHNLSTNTNRVTVPATDSFHLIVVANMTLTPNKVTKIVNLIPTEFCGPNSSHPPPPVFGLWVDCEEKYLNNPSVIGLFDHLVFRSPHTYSIAQTYLPKANVHFIGDFRYINVKETSSTNWMKVVLTNAVHEASEIVHYLPDRVDHLVVSSNDTNNEKIVIALIIDELGKITNKQWLQLTRLVFELNHYKFIIVLNNDDTERWNDPHAPHRSRTCNPKFFQTVVKHRTGEDDVPIFSTNNIADFHQFYFNFAICWTPDGFSVGMRFNRPTFFIDACPAHRYQMQPILRLMGLEEFSYSFQYELEKGYTFTKTTYRASLAARYIRNLMKHRLCSQSSQQQQQQFQKQLFDRLRYSSVDFIRDLLKHGTIAKIRRVGPSYLPPSHRDILYGRANEAFRYITHHPDEEYRNNRNILPVLVGLEVTNSFHYTRWLLKRRAELDRDFEGTVLTFIDYYYMSRPRRLRTFQLSSPEHWSEFKVFFTRGNVIDDYLGVEKEHSNHNNNISFPSVHWLKVMKEFERMIWVENEIGTPYRGVVVGNVEKAFLDPTSQCVYQYQKLFTTQPWVGILHRFSKELVSENRLFLQSFPNCVELFVYSSTVYDQINDWMIQQRPPQPPSPFSPNLAILRAYPGLAYMEYMLLTKLERQSDDVLKANPNEPNPPDYRFNMNLFRTNTTSRQLIQLGHWNSSDDHFRSYYPFFELPLSSPSMNPLGFKKVAISSGEELDEYRYRPPGFFQCFRPFCIASSSSPPPAPPTNNSVSHNNGVSTPSSSTGHNSGSSTRSSLSLLSEEMHRITNKYVSGALNLLRSNDRSVAMMTIPTKEEYQRIFTQNILFVSIDTDSDLVDETIIEALIHHTPILVNRCPLSEELLGSLYPFLYDDIYHAVELLKSMDTIERTHHFLREFCGDLKQYLLPMKDILRNLWVNPKNK